MLRVTQLAQGRMRIQTELSPSVVSILFLVLHAHIQWPKPISGLSPSLGLDYHGMCQHTLDHAFSGPHASQGAQWPFTRTPKPKRQVAIQSWQRVEKLDLPKEAF